MQIRKKQDSLGFKLGFSFGLVGLILIGALLITIFEIQNVNNTTKKMTITNQPFTEQSIDIIRGLEHITDLQEGMIIQKSGKKSVEITTIWEQQIIPSITSIRNVINRNNNPSYSQAISNLMKQLQKIRLNQTQVVTALNQNQYNEAVELNEKTHDMIDQASLGIQQLLYIQQQQLLGGINDVKKRVSRLAIMDWSFLIVGFILCALMVNLLTRFITKPIYQLVEITKEIARGRLDQQINISGTVEFDALSEALKEMVATFQNLAKVTGNMARGDYTHRVSIKSHEDRLAITVNQMLDNFTQIIHQADSIAEGDYTADIKPRSDKDVLGSALQNMTIKLRRNKQRNDDESWVKDGLTDFASKISGSHDLKKLCETGISNICHYIHAGVGTIYLYNDNQQVLVLSGSYALYELGNINKHYKMGQGIIGQVAKEHKTAILKNVPKEIHTISSGSMHTAPQQIYVMPIIFEEKLLAIMEIGVTQDVTDLQQYYIEQTSRIFASQLHSAKQQSLTKQLLNDSKMLTEKLQMQQEELRATNEELEQQTDILKASEEELKRKDEAQKQINKELEERNITLETQKTEIIQKTKAIQKAGVELKEKADELERASRYKSEFLANMSHELRTPLNSLLILAKMLADNDDGNLNEDQIDSASIILKSGQDLLMLINDILDLAKVEAGKIELYYSISDFENFIESCHRNFDHVAEKKGIKFKSKLQNGIPPDIYTDENRVTQIIRNLISNAIKFTEHGSVTLYIHRPRKDVDLSISKIDRMHSVGFSVIDTGIGIPDDKQKLIFGSFQQADGSTSRKYGGTGLGLSISLQLARLLGGEIQLQSIENKGSTFTLYLPEKELPDELKPAALIDEDDIKVTVNQINHDEEDKTLDSYSTITDEEEYEEEEDSNDVEVEIEDSHDGEDDKNSFSPEEKILIIIEDDNQFAKILANFGRKKGFKCIHAHNGLTGLEFANKYNPAGILLDLGLPDIDGLSLLDKLKNDPKTCSIPVHVISAQEKKSDAIQKGAIGYLTKPVSKSQLDSAIKKLESTINCDIRDLLITEDDEKTLSTLKKLFSDSNVNISGATTGEKALQKLGNQHFDCLILDLELPDMTGQELLNQFYETNPEDIPAIIIYTGQQLSRAESDKLNQFVDCIIVKGTEASVDRLIDETNSFLHQIKTNRNQNTMNIKKSNKSKPQMQKNISHEILTEKLEGKNILIVDDDMRNTFALSKTLRNKGCEVLMAANGKKAVEIVEENSNIDLVLMDIMMPVMDGYEAMRLIRTSSESIKIPIIALTAKAMKGDREKCIEAGATDFLTKPVDVDKLFSLMVKWLS